MSAKAHIYARFGTGSCSQGQNQGMISFSDSGVSSAQCEVLCNADSQCRSFTTGGPDSDNPNSCKLHSVVPDTTSLTSGYSCMVQQACCPQVLVAGAPSVQYTKNGLFTATGQVNNSHPVYQNEDSEYLSFSSYWQIGKQGSYGIRQVNNGGTGCPYAFTEWEYLDSGGYWEDAAITVQCVDASAWYASGGLYWIDAGCQSVSHTIEGRYALAANAIGAARCCHDAPAFCITQSGNCPHGLTYAEAEAECKSINMRLCTKAELLSGICCTTGGNCDFHAVWTSTLKVSNLDLIGNGFCRPSGCDPYYSDCRVNGFMHEPTTFADCFTTCNNNAASCLGFAITSESYDPVPKRCFIYTTSGSELVSDIDDWEHYPNAYYDISSSSLGSGVQCYRRKAIAWSVSFVQKECCSGNDCSQSTLHTSVSLRQCQEACDHMISCIGIEYDETNCTSNNQCVCMLVTGSCDSPNHSLAYNIYLKPQPLGNGFVAMPYNTRGCTLNLGQCKAYAAAKNNLYRNICEGSDPNTHGPSCSDHPLNCWEQIDGTVYFKGAGSNSPNTTSRPICLEGHDLIDNSGMTPMASSDGGYTSVATALTTSPINTLSTGSTCTVTDQEDQPWWKVVLPDMYDIRSITITNRHDCCFSRLQGVDVYVGGIICASNVQVPAGASLDVPCIGRGSEIKVQHQLASEVLTICGFQAYGTKAMHIAELGTVRILDLTISQSNLKGFLGAFTDGTYGYLVPNSNTRAVRFALSDFSSISVLDLAILSPNLRGFQGGFVDETYGYFVPRKSNAQFGSVVRFALSDFSTVTILEVELINSKLKLFQGGFSDGSYGYLVPGKHGRLGRFALNDFASVTFIDLVQIDPNLGEFSGGFIDAAYGYLVPKGQFKKLGKVCRFSLATFSSSSVSVLNLKAIDPLLRGFSGGFTDGTYGYVVPHAPPSEAKAGRFSLSDFSSVEVLDFSVSYPTLGAFRGGFHDGTYGYLVPYGFGVLVRFTLSTFGHLETVVLSSIDAELEMGFFGGFAHDGYGYLGPAGNPNKHGKVLRFPVATTTSTTTSTNTTSSTSTTNTTITTNATTITAPSTTATRNTTTNITIALTQSEVAGNLNASASTTTNSTSIAPTLITTTNSTSTTPSSTSFATSRNATVATNTTNTATPSSTIANSSSATNDTSSSASLGTIQNSTVTINITSVVATTPPTAQNTTASINTTSVAPTLITTTNSTSTTPSSTSFATSRNATVATNTTNAATPSSTIANSSSATNDTSSSASLGTIQNSTVTINITSVVATTPPTAQNTTASINTTSVATTSPTTTNATSTTSAPTTSITNSTIPRNITITSTTITAPNSTIRTNSTTMGPPFSKTQKNATTTNTTTTLTTMPTTIITTKNATTTNTTTTLTTMPTTITTTSTMSSTHHRHYVSGALAGASRVHAAAALAALATKNSSIIATDSMYVLAVRLGTQSPTLGIDGVLRHEAKVPNANIKAAIPSQLLESLGSDVAAVITVFSDDFVQTVLGSDGSRSADGVIVKVSGIVALELSRLNGVHHSIKGLSIPIFLTLPANYDNANIRCHYLDEQENKWSEIGMTTHSDSHGKLLCATTHLSMFGAALGTFEEAETTSTSTTYASTTIVDRVDLNLALEKISKVAIASAVQSLTNTNQSISIVVTDTVLVMAVRMSTQPVTKADDGTLRVESKVPDSDVKVAVPLKLLNTLGDDVAAVFIVYSEDLVKETLGETESYDANGHVVQVTGVVVFELNRLNGSRYIVEELDEPILLTLPANYSGKGMECQFWDEEDKSWSGSGITTDSDSGKVVCAITHLSMFAAIVSATGLDDALACAQMDMLAPDALKNIFVGTWWYGPASIAVWILLLVHAVLFAIAIYADFFSAHGQAFGIQTFITDNPTYKRQPGGRFEQFRQQVVGELHEISRDIGLARSRKFPCCMFVETLLVIALVSCVRISFATKFKFHVRDVKRVSRKSKKIVRAEKRRSINEGDADMVKIADIGTCNMLGEVSTISAASAVSTGAQFAGFHEMMMNMLSEYIDEMADGDLNLGRFMTRVWDFFIAMHPMLTVYLPSAYQPATLRTLLLAARIFGCCLISGVFFEGSGYASGKGAPAECSPDGNFMMTVAIAVTSSIISTTPLFLILALHTRDMVYIAETDVRARRRLELIWTIEDALLWGFGGLYTLFSITFTLSFLANISVHDNANFLIALLASCVKMLLLIPLSMACILAVLTYAGFGDVDLIEKVRVKMCIPRTPENALRKSTLISRNLSIGRVTSSASSHTVLNDNPSRGSMVSPSPSPRPTSKSPRLSPCQESNIVPNHDDMNCQVKFNTKVPGLDNQRLSMATTFQQQEKNKLDGKLLLSERTNGMTSRKYESNGMPLYWEEIMRCPVKFNTKVPGLDNERLSRAATSQLQETPRSEKQCVPMKSQKRVAVESQNCMVWPKCESNGRQTNFENSLKSPESPRRLPGLNADTLFDDEEDYNSCMASDEGGEEIATEYLDNELLASAVSQSLAKLEGEQNASIESI